MQIVLFILTGRQWEEDLSVDESCKPGWWEGPGPKHGPNNVSRTWNSIVYIMFLSVHPYTSCLLTVMFGISSDGCGSYKIVMAQPFTRRCNWSGQFLPKYVSTCRSEITWISLNLSHIPNNLNSMLQMYTKITLLPLSSIQVFLHL